MLQKIIYSIFPGISEQDKSREGYRHFYKSLIFHFRPRLVYRKTLDFTLTFGLGGMAFVLILLLFGTGLLMKFYYLPFPDKAYESIIYLSNNVPFGSLIRNIHYWSANMLIIVVFLHFLRVFFTSAFHPPRQFNWVIGLGLFVIILLFNFTGYLLPWDQLSFWAITICTSMMDYIPVIGKWMQNIVRGGADVGSPTLSIFYAAHTAFLPAALIIIMPFHFWRVRKAGGLVIPLSSEEKGEDPDIRVPAIPDLILREIVTALVLIAVILFISILFDAPLGNKANPGLSPNPTKAPWYFMGFQEILMHLHPIITIFVIPFLMVAGLLTIAYTRYPAGREGIWFVSSRGRSAAVASSVMALILTPIIIILDEYVFDFPAWMPGFSPVVSNGLIPLCIVILGFYVLYLFFVKFYSPDKNEKVQMVFVFFLTVFIILTITGIWFRGKGMKLLWPV
ncbi:MAG: cytochrome b N-terminal domain-containing protein [Deltaproteobacteria bacterium]|nr:cytochrome b N-terminal domain-containing protein [Deltaproteobacteria bacterium]